MADRFDVAILGAGSAGSEAAFTIAGLPGWKGAIGPGRRRRVLLVEQRHLGGTCTNEGCVPTKALVRAARVLHLARSGAGLGLKITAAGFDWRAVTDRMGRVRDQMLRFGTAPFLEQGLEVRFPAAAHLAGSGRVVVDGEEVEADAILLATGLRPAVPPIPGLAEAGFLDNETALALPALPRRLAVLGGGPIGCEFAQVFARFGVQVTVVEALDGLLTTEEPEAGATLAEAFGDENISVRTSARVTSVTSPAIPGAPKRLCFESGPDLEVDELLVATGRTLDGAALGLDAAGVEWTPKGVTVNDRLETTAEGVWAAGDVVGGPLFTHVASEMGQVAGRNAALGGSDAIDLRVLPRVTFTDPEVASVGITEADARRSGREVRVGLARLAEAEKAQIDGIQFGYVKAVADARTAELLGCSIAAEEAGSMIHEAVALMAGHLSAGLGATTMHAYPTLSELMRSALAEAAGH